MPDFQDLSDWHIDAHEQILLRSPNLFPELPKFFQSATIFLVHKKPPVEVVLGCVTLSYLFTGGFFFPQCRVTY